VSRWRGRSPHCAPRSGRCFRCSIAYCGRWFLIPRSAVVNSIARSIGQSNVPWSCRPRRNRSRFSFSLAPSHFFWHGFPRAFFRNCAAAQDQTAMTKEAENRNKHDTDPARNGAAIEVGRDWPFSFTKLKIHRRGSRTGKSEVFQRCASNKANVAPIATIAAKSQSLRECRSHAGAGSTPDRCRAFA